MSEQTNMMDQRFSDNADRRIANWCAPFAAGFLCFGMVALVGVLVFEPEPMVLLLSKEQERTDILRQKLEPISGNDLWNPWTPQYQAVTWLANDDPAEVDENETPLSVLTERYIVALLYFATNGGKDWEDNKNFLTASSVCAYSGIHCDDFGSVKSINLGLNNLGGTLPSEIGLLDQLRMLSLHHNGLAGTLPTELGNLSQLEVLSLCENHLEGAVPSELGKLSKLEVCLLCNNHLSGIIPSQLGVIDSLNYLSLENNSLSGDVPPELGRLEGLDLDNNALLSSVKVDTDSTAKHQLPLEQNQVLHSIEIIE